MIIGFAACMLRRSACLLAFGMVEIRMRMVCNGTKCELIPQDFPVRSVYPITGTETGCSQTEQDNESPRHATRTIDSAGIAPLASSFRPFRRIALHDEVWSA
jgi:hypothetical protein